ncbi:MAG: MBL fold metallo-hydrolase [Gammaproteobacteria bacterium]|nr:MAG: MBL fold metallo-hydrolase [Gammaproteobacteria bacterium]
MRFACLGSGSKGNAWLLESGATRVLLDCGFGVRETAQRLQRLGIEPDMVDAVVVTHEHSDHGRGVARFAARYDARIHLTHGCHAMLAASSDLPAVSVIDSHTVFAIGDLEFHPYPVPHDAREPVQYIVSDGARRFGLLTDVGHVTDHMTMMLTGCDALVLECNHDVDMLKAGSYPPSLKTRILGRYGHLDNQAAGVLMGRVKHAGLQHVVAAHLSEENNTPALAQAALADALGCEMDWIGVADQQSGLEWRSIA